MKPRTVQSLLDLDLYKLTMMQFFWKYFPNLKVKYQFKNRTQRDLGEYLTKEILDNEFDEIKSLRFSECEITYLKSIGLFGDDFLNFLRNYKLPNIIVTDDLDIYTEESEYCKNSILWETIVLSAVNQLYYEHKYTDRNVLVDDIEGLQTLNTHLEMLSSANIKGLVTDFGTRRRFSHNWQDRVCSYISKHESFAGTSNVFFAKKYGIKPIGTNAHELYMIASGVFDTGTDKSLKESHSKVMNMWYEMYGENLSIGLTDTFGTDFFFEDFKDKANDWKGLRHDSGDPFEFGENVINYYESLGIDPTTKLIVFSDGLSAGKIIDLYTRFNGRIKISFGWGTKLTNNLGYETLSIVMKAVKVTSNDDQPINNYLVKLSDNLNKHMGPTVCVERYKAVFNYNNVESEKLEV